MPVRIACLSRPVKRTISLIVFILTLSLIFPVCILICGFATPACFDETFLGELVPKIERLESTEEPKIIVIGGSSVAFGIRSDIMESELGMPVVNFGLYASLGTKVMLDLSRAGINDGDIIIIAPEQDSQTLSGYFNADAVWKAFDGNFGYLKYIDSENLPSMAGSFPAFVADKFRFLSDGGKPEVSGVYAASSFNDYCDIAYERKSNTMYGGYDTNTPISFDTSVISRGFISYLNDYAAYAEEKGAKVYFSFSPMNKAALKEDEDEATIKQYYDFLSSSLLFPVISSPEKYIMESGWFYDSNFHMNDAGAVAHTVNLINDIKLAEGDMSPVTVKLPAMPKAEDDDDINNGGNERFTYTEGAGGLKITGLTGDALTAARIVMPAEIDGKPIRSIGKNAFSDNRSVTEIVIPAGLSQIENGAFDGCAALERLVMLTDKPSETRVDEGLLTGAPKCTVLVSEAAYGAFTNDYYWSVIFDLGKIKIK